MTEQPNTALPEHKSAIFTKAVTLDARTSGFLHQTESKAKIPNDPFLKI